MTWITHTAFAFFSSSLLGLNTYLAVVGSTAPDWFEDLFGIREHRGVSHYLTLWFGAFLLSLILLSISNDLIHSFGFYLLSFVFGGLTHLLLDALTVSGVPLGAYRTRIRIGGLIRTGKLSEWVFLSFLVLVFVPLLSSGSLEFGFSKYKKLYEMGIIDKREYLERRFRFFE